MRVMAILGISYAFALCAVFVAALVCSDYWRVFPMWMVWLTLTTYQAVMVQVLGPWDKNFWLREWMPAGDAAAGTPEILPAYVTATEQFPVLRVIPPSTWRKIRCCVGLSSFWSFR